MSGTCFTEFGFQLGVIVGMGLGAVITSVAVAISIAQIKARRL